MTGAEIRALAESYIDDSIEDTDARLWINDFLEEPELIEEFRKTADQTITIANPATWQDRTAGHLGVVRIVNDDGLTYTGEIEFNHDRTKLRLDTADTYTITSLVQPAAYTDATLAATPDINTIFHRAIAAYMAGKFKLKENARSEAGMRLMAEGIAKAKRAAEMLTVQDSREVNSIRCVF